MNNLKASMKQGALMAALALIVAAPVFANPDAKECADEAKKAEPSIVISEADKAKLEKREVVIGTQSKPNGRRWVTAKIRIAAQPHVVWNAVHEERKSDPDLAYSKIVEEGKNEQTLEQKFQLLPIVGTSVCLIKSSEIPNKRIDYYLLKSDRFKAVEGSWILQPTEDGGTILELASYIDIGMPAPRSVVENIAGKKLERRVNNVRRVAESEAESGKKVAQKNEPRSGN